MTNAVEVRRIAGYLDAMALLGGRVIVDLLAIEGVRFGTERASSGAVAGAESPAAPELGVDVGSFELPSWSTRHGRISTDNSMPCSMILKSARRYWR